MTFTKRISALVLAAVLTLSVAGCGNSSAAPASSAASAVSATASSAVTAEKTTVKVGTLKGPTGLGMVKMMSDAEQKKTAENYQFTMDTQPTAAVAKLTSGEVDIAGLPTNLAAALYQKTAGKVQMIAINTLGVLSIVTNGESVSSIADLKGKTVYNSGKGSVPEYAYNYILKQNGLNPEKDVKTVYEPEHSAVLAKVLAGEAKIAVLPEPFVTQALVKCKTAKLALNLTTEWNKASKGGSVLSMGCLLVRKEFAEKHKDALDKFLKEYKASVEYTNANAAQAGKLAQKYLSMPAAVATKAIPNCSITYMDGSEMKEKLQPFFKVLYQENPKSVGGKLPDDGLYYQK